MDLAAAFVLAMHERARRSVRRRLLGLGGRPRAVVARRRRLLVVRVAGVGGIDRGVAGDEEVEEHLADVERAIAWEATEASERLMERFATEVGLKKAA